MSILERVGFSWKDFQTRRILGKMDVIVARLQAVSVFRRLLKRMEIERRQQEIELTRATDSWWEGPSTEDTSTI